MNQDVTQLQSVLLMGAFVLAVAVAFCVGAVVTGAAMRWWRKRQ